MDDFKQLKQIVEEVTLSETKCIQIMRSLLAQENEHLHNDVLDKIVSVLEKWSFTPPVEILKELEELGSQKHLS